MQSDARLIPVPLNSTATETHNLISNLVMPLVKHKVWLVMEAEIRTKFKVMTRRTYEADAEHIETADDLDDLVHDKREGWRANSSKARRRQRRYKKRLTNELLRMDYSDDD